MSEFVSVLVFGQSRRPKLVISSRSATDTVRYFDVLCSDISN
jgi:hypothetical protein